MRALGIDPGTKNFDLCCIEDDVDNVVLDKSIPSEVVANEPSQVFNIIKDAEADVIVGPSGYGLEFKHISQFTKEEVALTTLDKVGDIDIPVLSGLRKLLWMMKRAGLNAYSAPGVVQLPTIPLHRKVNKIDMGTADKTCVTAFAIWDQAKKRRIVYNETSLICVEMGFGYNAAMAVENGQIIDGVGGTIFPGPGYLTLSQMDGELAYILGEFSKLKLFEAGATFIAARKMLEVEDFCRNLNLDEYRLAWQSVTEGIIKAVAMLQTSFMKRPREIILTGRLSRVERLRSHLEKILNEKFGIPVRRPVHNFTKKAKDVAQGTTLLANGIAGGKYRELVETMKIKEAKGTVLDYIFFPDFDKKVVLKKLRNG
ncbi:MAG: DUF1464 family protein [Candidatus Bathyarchaeia archaeon]